MIRNYWLFLGDDLDNQSAMSIQVEFRGLVKIDAED